MSLPFKQPASNAGSPTEPCTPRTVSTTEHHLKTPRWHLLPADPARVQLLQSELGINPLFCQLLVQRGVSNRAEAERFFKPQLDALHDPFLMQDMDLAVERLHRAINQSERILLYGDYDVDGTTSVALMYAFLSNFYKNIDFYLPDRDKEGYGVSLAGVEYARDSNCKLIIAIDCGIKAHEAIALAKSYGIDFIVCDHHVPEGGLPVSVANLDPKRSDCAYPYKELSGCGIAFKLAQAMAQSQQVPVHEIESLLDLVAISIACDIVPITGENRVLAFLGLRQLNQSPRTGLWALITRINKSYPLIISDLVFGMGPIINAAGRLGDAREAVQLMLAEDRNSALERAGTLVHRNRQRRTVDYATAAEARQLFMDLPDWNTRKSIVLYNPDWHKGIIGIASSRLTEEFHRPSVVLTLSNNRVVGSARSVRGFDLYTALQACEDLFYSFGGHAFAAGMQMPVENVAAFAIRFEQLVQEQVSLEDERPLLEISAPLRLDEINHRFWKTLQRFEPFGPQNRSPVFWAKAVVDTGKSKLLDNNHVRLSLRQADGGNAITGIGFGLGDRFIALRDGPFDILYSIREEAWHGQTVLSLTIKDLQPCGVLEPTDA
jgi:single-stranded-DNA-specific exonuclease